MSVHKALPAEYFSDRTYSLPTDLSDSFGYRICHRKNLIGLRIKHQVVVIEVAP